MILKYEVIKNGQVIHSGGASSEAEIHEQLKPYYEHKTFGEPEKTIQVLVSEEVPELREIQRVLVTPEVRDPETDEVITEAVYEDQEVVVQEYAPAVYREELIPAEYTIEITDVTAITEAIEQIAEAKSYLSSTDYMAIREFEGGEPMPLDVKTQRANKRALINSLETQFDL